MKMNWMLGIAVLGAFGLNANVQAQSANPLQPSPYRLGVDGTGGPVFAASTSELCAKYQGSDGYGLTRFDILSTTVDGKNVVFTALFSIDSNSYQVPSPVRMMLSFGDDFNPSFVITDEFADNNFHTVTYAIPLEKLGIKTAEETGDLWRIEPMHVTARILSNCAHFGASVGFVKTGKFPNP